MLHELLGLMMHLHPILKQIWPRALRAGTYPAISDDHVLYAIGDIHGRADCLERAHRLIDRDRAMIGHDRPCTELYLGDYIDRGPRSKDVIDLLLARCRSRETVFLRGNHEIMASAVLEGEMSLDSWRPFGGAATLQSYGFTREEQRHEGPWTAAMKARITPAHRAFLAGLIDYHRHEDYCFVHAGVRPDCALAAQSQDDLAWIRHDFLAHRGDFGFVVVHGHTPVDDIDFRQNRINIDTGAYSTGRLTVLKIDEDGPRRLAVLLP